MFQWLRRNKQKKIQAQDQQQIKVENQIPPIIKQQPLQQPLQQPMVQQVKNQKIQAIAQISKPQVKPKPKTIAGEFWEKHNKKIKSTEKKTPSKLKQQVLLKRNIDDFQALINFARMKGIYSLAELKDAGFEIQELVTELWNNTKINIEKGIQEKKKELQIDKKKL